MPQEEKARGRNADQVAQDIERAGRGESGDRGRAHEQSARLLRNPNFRRALEELNTNTSAREEAKRDPKGYLRGKGIDLPDEATVEFQDQPTV